MKNYINAEKLKEKIYAEDTVCLAHGSLPEFDQGCHYALLTVLSFIGSLQQEQPEDIMVPRWCLENIEDTLRIQNNINSGKETGETCQDRNIRCSLNQLRKLLNGKELTGIERMEPLQEQPEVDLDF